MIRRAYTEAEKKLFNDLSKDFRFAEFRDVLAGDLATLRQESDTQTDPTIDAMSKGSRQYISLLLELTEKRDASPKVS